MTVPPAVSPPPVSQPLVSKSVSMGAGRRGPGALVGLLAVLVGLLAGCGGAGGPDTAAVVGGRAISSADVRVAAKQLSEHVDEVNEAMTLNFLIFNELATEPAAATGVWRPDGAYTAMLTRVPQPAEPTIAALTGFFANRAMRDAGRTAVLSERARALGVTVSPRFGTFDPATAQLADPQPNWIRSGAAATLG